MWSQLKWSQLKMLTPFADSIFCGIWKKAHWKDTLLQCVKETCWYSHDSLVSFLVFRWMGLLTASINSKMCITMIALLCCVCGGYVRQRERESDRERHTKREKVKKALVGSECKRYRPVHRLVLSILFSAPIIVMPDSPLLFSLYIEV